MGDDTRSFGRFEGDSIQFYERLSKGMELAREKHPIFAKDAYHALDVIEDELAEFTHAIYYESKERQIEEAWDVAITCFRFILREHEKTIDNKTAST